MNEDSDPDISSMSSTEGSQDPSALEASGAMPPLESFRPPPGRFKNATSFLLSQNPQPLAYKAAPPWPIPHTKGQETAPGEPSKTALADMTQAEAKHGKGSGDSGRRGKQKPRQRRKAQPLVIRLTQRKKSNVQPLKAPEETEEHRAAGCSRALQRQKNKPLGSEPRRRLMLSKQFKASSKFLAKQNNWRPCILRMPKAGGKQVRFLTRQEISWRLLRLRDLGPGFGIVCCSLMLAKNIAAIGWTRFPVSYGQHP